MRRFKKILCITLATVMAMGTTVNASGAVLEGNTSDSSTVIEEPSKGDDISYIKNYAKINGISDSTILGADFSHYQQDQAWNKVYYDYKSNKLDNVFSFVKSQGVNTISVRVTVDPKEEFAYLSLDNAIKTIKEAKAAGLDTNMILMYSDEITYQNSQTLPEAWTAETAADQAKTYTATVLSKLETEGALPTMITVGNELNYNFLNITEAGGWDGWVAMGQITQLIKEKGVKVAIGIAAPTAAADIEWVIEKLNEPTTGITYDSVGVTIYPTKDTVEYMNTMRATFAEKAKDKQLFVSSVKYPRVSDTDTTVGVESQADNIYKLLSATIDDTNAGGLIYEEAEFVGSWYSFFNAEGQAQTSLAIFAYAQGKDVDVDTYRDPYQYGGETGLKDQTVNIKKIAGMTENAIRGMDIGSYIALKEAGVKYYNTEGKEESLLKILADNGINYIRIRIWNDPYNAKGEPYGGGQTDVETGLKIANEAKKYGMKIMLCFHYSDFWADPAQQIIPKAWQDAKDDPEKMNKYVYDFTKDTVKKFVDAGAEVGMVQVGNEITNGLLGTLTDRDKGGNYYDIWGNEEKSKLINGYLSAGSKAVREAAPEALIALHLETAEVKKYTNIMNTWERDNVDYDVLGSSYYPFWSVSEKANTPESLRAVQKLAADKGKLFVVLETAWCNTLKDSDGTANSIGEADDTSAYEIGPQGQVDCLTDMYEETMSHDNGLGAFYWEPAWIPVKAGWVNWKENKEYGDKYGTGWASAGALGYFSEYKMYYNGEPAWGGTSWDNNALFDFNGYALQSLKFYKDSISEGKEQVSVVKLVDTDGKEIAPAKFAKVYLGSSRNVSLPKVSGYELQNPASSIKVTGEVEGVKYYSVTYVKEQGISSKKDSYTMAYGSTLDLAKEITLATTGTAKYSSSNPDIVSIDAETGKMTAKALGTAVITVSVDKTATTSAATKKITVTVSRKPVTINSKKSAYTVKVGSTFDLAKELTFTNNKAAVYSSSDAKIASVDAKTGKITAKAAGKAVITVSVAKTATTAAATKKINVTVSPKTLTIKSKKSSYTMTYGGTLDLAKELTFSTKSTAKYTSSNSKVVSIDAKTGKMTAKGTGKAVITVSVAKTATTAAVTKKINVTVSPKVTVKNKGVQNFTAGKTYKLSSYMTISGASNKKFTSSNTSIAKVSSNGTITAVKPGKVTITVKVTAPGVSGTNQKKITVYVVPKKQKITKVTASSKALTVSLTKDKTASGYEIMVARNSKFTSGKKTVVVKKNSTLKTKVSNLSAKKQYYVRVRSYKTISNKKYYGSWSTVTKIKTK